MSQGEARHGIPGEAHFPEPSDHATLAKVLRGYRELVEELGGQPDQMLESAGIAPDAIEDPEARIAVRAVGQILEDSAARLGCTDFGMRLAERQSMRTVMEPLDRFFVAAPTVRDAFEGCSRHMNAFNSGLVMEIDDRAPEGLHMVDLRLLDGLALFPQLLEQLLLLTHNSILWLSAGFARSRRVWLSHLRISPAVAYARRFNTVIEFGQEYDALFFSPADMKARVAECSADIFASETRAIEERFPARHKDIDLQVRQMVHRILTEAEDCTRQNVANLLGVQERTLNRRLSRKGTSFETIRDEVRRDLAYRYLARADLPLTEIAGRLGYSEMAVLSRCCRRWFGTSPRRLRQELQAA